MMVATRLPGPSFRRDADRRENIRARARSRQHTFDRRQLLHHVEGIMIVDGDDLVGERAVECLGDEAGADAFHFVLAFLAAAQHRALRLNRNRQRLADCVLSDSAPRR